MPPPFETVREQLLRAGIAPRRASRYVTELREHLADLTARERASGLDAREATDRAMALLGSDAQLAQAMIDRGVPRSLSARAPWAVFALLPVAVLMGLVWAISTVMMHLLWPVHTTWPGGVPNTYTGLIAAASFVASYLLGPTITTVCIALALRQRLSSRWVWIGLGVIALFSGLLGFHMNILPPVGRHPGGAVFSTIPAVLVSGRVNAAATLEMAALRAALLFATAAMAYRALRMRLMPDHA